ncbi:MULTISPECIES: TonB-dependent receptor domain-containing protein [unclassified Shewanella]|uniref:TonB-dependent receptor domain-containing protein n=1 Tax=unclassified Shewanella TaxID=196818 RepID=UPI001BC0277F|nr:MULTISPECIES: TonB-dependent receptor [unclassified Shewanella]GIU04891.1 TonB-dependent receptor [Shewanella sp. MBTL60-112-B1]GIU24658.1 TonB-dependent receptor [Shewanella sp. MBTL60-112-B2]
MGTQPSKIALLVSSFISFTAFSVSAEDLGATSATIDETITVTGSRFDRTADQQLTVINTIEREEIVRLNPKSVADVLETLPGVSVSRNGGAGQATSISVRGSNSNHVLVLVDGVKVGSATLGTVSFNTLSPENIERIEVLKGPRASVWGSDAIGGVIQIFTRELKGGEWFAGAEYGSNDYVRGSFGTGMNHGEGSTTLAVNHEQSDGYDVYNGAEAENDDDGYKRNALSLKGSQQINQNWQALWNGQYDKGNTQYDDIYASGSADESDYENYLWSLATQYSREQFTSKLAVSQSQDSNENFRGDDASVAIAEFETKRDQVNWSNQYLAADDLTITGGIDWSREQVRGDYAEDQRDLFGAYALVQKQWSKLLAEVAVRYDDVENIDSETSYNASLAYQFNDQWRLAATTGTAFKAPTFNDLYWPDSGNPDLISETAESYELALHFNNQDLRAYISVFKNTIDNLIAWAPTGEQDDYGWDIWKPANINKAEISGIELSANFELFSLEHQLGYTYLDAQNKQTDEQLIGRSENEFNYLLSYTWQQFDLLANYHYQGKRYAGYEQYLDAYHKLDLSLGYQIDDAWSLRLKANNLFDEEIISDQNYFSPGRELFFSVSYQAF